jgi:cysteine desulfurase / selenocysteine lyase
VSIDVARARADTPGTESVAHLNNAGAALPPTPVLEAVIEHLRREAEIGGYEAAAEREDRAEHTYDAIAALLGARRDEIAIVENATRAWDMAFYSLELREGDRILTANAEYASNYIPMRQVADRTGASVVVVPDDEHGQIDVDRLATMLDERVKLVSLVHVPSQGGLVNPAAAVGALCRAAGVPLLLDACQSVGQMPVDVGEIGCDMLSATGRKFLRGPRGTGFLYVRRGLVEQLEPPLLDLHAAEWQRDGSYRIRPDARRFENWETNVATKIGLGVAVDYALAIGLEAIRDRVRALADDLRERLAALPGVTLHDLGEERSAIVTFTVAGHPTAQVVETLRGQGVNVSLSPATYARLDFDRRGLTDLVRASVHYYNDLGDLDRLVDGVDVIS